MSLSTLDYALAYHDLGWTVLPMRSQTKIPHVKWKEFRTKKPTKTQIRKWFNKWKDAGIGIVTGKASGIFTLDFDSDTAVGEYEANIGDLPETIRMHTGREGGFQLFLRYPDDFEIRNAAGFLQDLDIRAEGGLTVVPPSLHKSGNVYEWGKINPIEHGLDDLLEIPDELTQCLQTNGLPTKSSSPRGNHKSGTSNNKPGWVAKALLGVPGGLRNQTCAKLAGYYIRIFQGDAQQALTVLCGWNRFNEPPLDEAEIKKTVDSIAERHGVTAMGDFINHDIYQLEKLKYPDGDTKYSMYLEGQNVPIILTPEELASPNIFRVKLMTQTNQMMPPIKNNDWYALLNNTLPEALTVTMEEDETYISAIKEIIKEDISRGGEIEELEDPGVLIEKQAVIIGDDVFVKLNTLSIALQFSHIKITLKDLAGLLRRIGFKRFEGRINQTKVRTWTIKLRRLRI